MRVDSGPDNDESYQNCQMVRARLARRRGIREEPVSERPSSAPTSPKPGGHGLGRTAYPSGRSYRARRGRVWLARWGTRGPENVVGSEAMVKDCGVAMAMVQGHSWMPIPSNGQQ